MINEKNTASRSRIFDIIACVLFCGIFLVCSVVTFLLPDRNFSESENTVLTTLDDVFDGNLAKKLFSGDLTESAARYLRHQFPLREGALMLRSVADMALVRYETNGVIYGADGYLIPRKDFPKTEYLAGNLNAITALTVALERSGVDSVFALAPRPADVLERYYPSAYSSLELDRLRAEVLKDSLPLDLAPALKSAADRGEYVYYKTDHHWTSYGAYLAYARIIAEYGKVPVSLSEFERETVSTDFLGTSHSLVLTPFAEYDAVEYFHRTNGAEYICEMVYENKTLDGFYDRTFLDKKDKYSSFMGGNYGLVRVSLKNGETREKLLLVKDSYANAMIPFLAEHFDLVVVDPRYYKDSVYKLAENEGCRYALVLCSLDGLCDANSYLILNYGLPKE